MSKLPPLPQEYFDDNRERFSAETTIAEANFDKHKHELYQKSGSEFGCRNCTAGWIDTTGALKSVILASK